MKVRELIEILESFDQEKDIWVLYDYFDPQQPWFQVFDVQFPADDETDEIISEIKIGDYVHLAV